MGATFEVRTRHCSIERDYFTSMKWLRTVSVIRCKENEDSLLHLISDGCFGLSEIVVKEILVRNVHQVGLGILLRFKFYLCTTIILHNDQEQYSQSNQTLQPKS